MQFTAFCSANGLVAVATEFAKVDGAALAAVKPIRVGGRCVHLHQVARVERGLNAHEWPQLESLNFLLSSFVENVTDAVE